MAGLDAKQEEQGNALLVMKATQDSLRDDLDTARETLRATATTVGEQARDWTDLRTFAQQQAQSAQQLAQLAQIEASQSHLQSMFKRRGADFDQEGPPPRPRGPTFRLRMKRPEGPASLADHPAQQIVGSTDSLLRNLGTPFYVIGLRIHRL